MRATQAELASSGAVDLVAIGKQLASGAEALEQVVSYVVDNLKSDIKGVFAGSVPYLKLAGIVLGGWQLGRAALVAQRKLAEGAGDSGFYQAKIGTARFFAEHILSQAEAYRISVVEGSSGVMALTEDQF